MRLLSDQIGNHISELNRAKEKVKSHSGICSLNLILPQSLVEKYNFTSIYFTSI
jgi:hypothetical protein